MASQPDWLKKVVRDFRRAIAKKIRPRKIILFGSYAYGRPKRYSDIDLAVVSPTFSKMNDMERIMLLSDLSRGVPTPNHVDIDPLGFTEIELQSAGYFDLAAQIREKGRVVYSE